MTGNHYFDALFDALRERGETPNYSYTETYTTVQSQPTPFKEKTAHHSDENAETNPTAASDTDDSSADIENAVPAPEEPTLVDMVSAEEHEKAQDDLHRLRGEYANYRKRSIREKEEAHQRGVNAAVAAMLPTLDALEMAVKYGAQDETERELTKHALDPSVFLRDLQTQLASQGVRTIADNAVPFDPNIHEAVIVQLHEEFDTDTVVEVLRTGYVTDLGVIRAAQVIVAN